MKNKKRFSLLFTIILNVSFILCLIISIISILNFKSPPVIEENDFINYVNKLGCNVTNIQEHYNYENVKTYLSTEKSSCPNYAISYTVFNDNNTAQGFYNGIEKEMQNNIGNITFRSSANFGSSYKQYEITSTGYQIVVLNETSVLYFSTYKEYKTDAVNLYKNFNYFYDFNSFESKISLCAGFILLFILVISMWGIEKKIRNKGWIVLIPFYNVWSLFKDILGSGWYFLLMFIPIINFIFIIKFSYKLGRKFGKSKLFSMLCVLFPTIFYPIVALDDSNFILELN